MTDYWNHYHPFESEKTIALEKRIYMNLDDGDSYRFQGYVDRISKTADGTWQIRDYNSYLVCPFTRIELIMPARSECPVGYRVFVFLLANYRLRMIEITIKLRGKDVILLTVFWTWVTIPNT